MLIAERNCSVQIGDVSVGNFVGAADWDNFVIGTIPEPASLSLILFAGLLLRGLKRVPTC